MKLRLRYMCAREITINRGRLDLFEAQCITTDDRYPTLIGMKVEIVEVQMLDTATWTTTVNQTHKIRSRLVL